MALFLVGEQVRCGATAACQRSHRATRTHAHSQGQSGMVRLKGGPKGRATGRVVSGHQAMGLRPPPWGGSHPGFPVKAAGLWCCGEGGLALVGAGAECLGHGAALPKSCASKSTACGLDLPHVPTGYPPACPLSPGGKHVTQGRGQGRGWGTQ